MDAYVSGLAELSRRWQEGSGTKKGMVLVGFAITSLARMALSTTLRIGCLHAIPTNNNPALNGNDVNIYENALNGT